MRLTFDADVEEFRAEFVAFLDTHLPDEAQALFTHPGVQAEITASLGMSEPLLMELAIVGRCRGNGWPAP